MVEVQYSGRLGNQLFQYCFGRILAEMLGYRLKASPIPHFPGTSTAVEGQEIEAPIWECPERVTMKDFKENWSPRRIVVQGFMQRYRYYRRHREKIRQWVDIGRSEIQPEADGLVVHIRLGDYKRVGWVLTPDYYHSIISQEKFSRLYIVTDEPRSPLLESFQRYQPTMVMGSPIESLRFIRSARRIVLSQSSYSWWGAYLSEADKIYFPVPRRSIWTPGYATDLRVDEPRYIYVNDVETLPRQVRPSPDGNSDPSGRAPTRVRHFFIPDRGSTRADNQG